MVRFKPVKGEASSADSTRVGNKRRGRARPSAPHHPRMSTRTPRREGPSSSPGATGSDGSVTEQENERLFRLAARLRYVLLAVSVLMLIWFLVSLSGEKTWGVELSAPTWPVDIAAFIPLLVLIRFRKPEVRAEGVTLESDLKIFSGLYLFMSLPYATFDGRW